MMTTTLALDTERLHKISAFPTEAAPRRAATFLANMVNDLAFVEAEIPPLLEEAKDAEDWYVARRHDAGDGSFSLQVFVWPPGSATRIHDHSSWGAYVAAAGTVFEERYERLDDGSVPEHARLKKVWLLSWSREDGASTVMPGDGGIHRVGNPNDEPAVSIHLYGPRMEDIDGRDYDLSRDYVCDRPEKMAA